LYNVLKLAKSLGVITTAHCENPELISMMQQQLLAEGQDRSEVASMRAVRRAWRPRACIILMTFAEMLDARCTLVHTSCEEAVSEALACPGARVKVWIETLIQYLVTDMTYAELPDFEGSKYVMSPPLRTRRISRTCGTDCSRGSSTRWPRSRAV
jgi:dihydropyrimidinase